MRCRCGYFLSAAGCAAGLPPVAAGKREREAAVAFGLSCLGFLGSRPLRLWLLAMGVLPKRRAVERSAAAVLLVLGGFLSVLPVFGLRMLPLGLALMSEDAPWLKVPLEKASRGIVRLWARVRGGREAA